MRMQWPANTPTDIKQLADEIFDVLHGHDSDIIGPTIGIVFGFTILSLANRADDVAMVDKMMADVRELVVRYGAAVETQTH
jgi:hypothetical protein